MSQEIEASAKDVVDSTIKVHKALGPGLMESACQQCLSYELRQCGRKVLTELLVPIFYDNQQIDAGYRLDMLIDNMVIVENKTVETLLPIHVAQLLTHLKLKECKLGFLLNWNARLMKDGIQCVANGMPVNLLKKS
ncbi:MAG: GxxExxY protein [Anaerolineales bacterium]|nr:GxxExxY protein [Anaerolineales bacterium]